MAVDSSRVLIHNYSSVNVTTSAYVELIAATGISIAHIAIEDTSGQILKLAIGPAGSEIDIAGFHITTLTGSLILPYYIPAGTRLSIISVNANATTGFNVLSLIPW
jgi:hypothetical protein